MSKPGAARGAAAAARGTKAAAAKSGVTKSAPAKSATAKSGVTKSAPAKSGGAKASGAAAFDAIFRKLAAVFKKYEKTLAVKNETAKEYTLVTKSPSPFAQHKGHPMWFGSIRLGKAYVSFHLMPLYMKDPLQRLVTPELARHMQGKSCFNFKTEP